MESYVVALIIAISCGIGASVALYHATKISAIPIAAPVDSLESSALVNSTSADDAEPANMYERMKAISGFIARGADAFLYAEFYYIAIFCTIFGIALFITLGVGSNWTAALFTLIAFVAGCLTSIASGLIGMKIAVRANVRTAIQARYGYEESFNIAFKAGMVMGFGLVSIGLITLFVLVSLVSLHYDTWKTDNAVCHKMFETVSGFGLGGSTIALFSRVGGGIYTKAADVGADLSGKVCNDFPEDDPRNPAVVADNVGDNVGDIAGMGADLFGSLAEGSCATMVVAASLGSDLHKDWAALLFPIALLSLGLIVSWVTSFVATDLFQVSNENEIEPALKRQLLVSTLLMTPVAFLACYLFLPTKFAVAGHVDVKYWHIFFCVATGLWCGLIIGYITEYFTSFAYSPVRECAAACEAGAAPNIIYGLALGYKSCITPVLALCFTIYLSHSLAGMYGISAAALGILSTMATGLTIDAYGPICDNAGGIAEMCHMPHHTRERTDNLDAAGNTTAAIGKGFAIGSAALVALALFGAFTVTAKIPAIDILRPFPFAGLLAGAMIPYWFSALTMKSVGIAAFDMVKEVERQLDINTESGRLIRQQQKDPDYEACIAISTKASLREMIAPGALVLFSPILVGFLLGTECLAGFLAGIMTSGVQIAISASNTGGAWDNTKKLIGGVLNKKGSEEYKAAVIGDTVGDPLKDTSGPSVNILIKLTAVCSLVLAPSMPSRGYIVQLGDKIF